MPPTEQHAPDLDDATAVPVPGTKMTTPGEFAAVWNEHDQPGRQRMLTAILDAMDARMDCFLQDHAARLQWWEGQASPLSEIAAERARQNEKWGEQNHPDGTGPGFRPLLPHLRVNAVPPHANARDLAFAFTRATDEAARRGEVTWRDILLEEVFEALAEDDPAKLRTELVQVAAVATQWVEAIDRRTA